ALVYFGRERLIEDVVKRLHQDHLVTIAGPSASGKSSLIRAGLLPKVFVTDTETSEHRIIAITPGDRPFQRLIDALSQVSPPSELSLGRDLTRDHWLALFRETLERGERGCLLVVDQFEEIFRAGSRSSSFEQCVAFVTVLADIRARALPSMS